MDATIVSGLVLVLATAFLVILIFTWKNMMEGWVLALRLFFTISLLSLDLIQANWWLAGMWAFVTFLNLILVALLQKR